VEDPDLAEVAGVVADGDGLTDVGGEGRVEVAQTLEADAVAVHHPGLGDLDEQQVQLLEAVGGAGQPAVGDPGLLRALPGLAVLPLVVGTGDPLPDRGVELRQREPRRSHRLPVDQLPGQVGKQLGGEGAEEPLVLAAALRAGDRGVHELEVQIGGDLDEVVAGEVAAVVGVQDVGQAMHRPTRVGLAPDRLPQRQREVQRGRGAKEHGVAGDRAGAVVEHDGQPRPGRCPRLVEHEQVELGVVGLPDLVRPLRLAPVDQLVAVPQRHRPVVRQRQQLRVQGGHDRVDGAVGRDRPAVLEGRAARPAGDARDPGSGTLQRPRRPAPLSGRPCSTSMAAASRSAAVTSTTASTSASPARSGRSWSASSTDSRRVAVPGPAEDCYAVLQWLVASADELGVDATRIAVLGDSAGGGLAATTALLARDRGGPALAMQVLIEPELDDRLQTHSMRTGADTPVWHLANAQKSWEFYLGGQDATPYAAPARMQDLSGLPPTYLTVNELDPLRDEGLDYAQRLLVAGVPTEVHCFAGTFHGFVLVSTAQVTQRALAMLLGVLRRGLGVELPPGAADLSGAGGARAGGRRGLPAVWASGRVAGRGCRRPAPTQNRTEQHRPEGYQ